MAALNNAAANLVGKPNKPVTLTFNGCLAQNC